MSTLAQPLLPANRLKTAQWAAIGIFVAVALGMATAVNPLAGIGLAVMLGVGAATVLRPASILIILTLSIFIEIVSVGGTTISRLVAPIALLVVLVELMRGAGRMQRGSQLAWVCGYSLIALASGLWSVNAGATATLLASLLIALTYMLCYAVLLDSEQQLRRVLFILACGSLVVGAWSLASFKGWTVGSSSGLQAGRAQGGVGDPNFFANIQLVVLPIVLVLAADTKVRWMRYFLGFTALVGVASILSTLSRGGLIALILVLLLIPFVPARAIFPSPRHKAVIIAFLAVGLLVLFSRPGFRGEVVKRATTIFNQQAAAQSDSSGGSGREEIWKAAEHSIRDRPLLGVGFGAFPSVSSQLLYNTPGVDLGKFPPRVNGIEVHSAFLGTAAELGFVGLFLFVGMIISTILALRRTAVRARNAGAHFLSRVSNALVLSLIGWSLSSMFIETETSRPLWIVIGLSLALPKLVSSYAAAGSRGPAAL
jgi:putative inorganic carbon (HCO3(-)) transporter